jgi:hypothetical protein
MADPRLDTVVAVLREAGVQTNFDDTDTLAGKIVAALDREHGAPTEAGEAEAGEAGETTAPAEGAPSTTSPATETTTPAP